MPDAFVTTSSFVSPQFRSMSGSPQPPWLSSSAKVGRYVRHLDGALRKAGVSGDLRIMASNGGVATAKMVTEKRR